MKQSNFDFRVKKTSTYILHSLTFMQLIPSIKGNGMLYVLYRRTWCKLSTAEQMYSTCMLQA